MPRQENSVVGKITKLFGTDGEVQIKLYDIFPDDFTLTEPLFVEIDKLTVPFFCDSFERRGRSSATVRFADIDNEQRAGELVDKDIMLPFDKEDEASDEAIYFEDMAGYSATLDDSYNGIVEEFIDGENPLLRLSVDGKEVFVPAVDEFIEDIDPKRRRITISLPEGLLELYL